MFLNHSHFPINFSRRLTFHPFSSEEGLEIFISTVRKADAGFAVHCMIMKTSKFNFTVAPEEWAFDSSFRASVLMLLYLVQRKLDLTPKLSVLAWVRDSLNELVGKGVCSIFRHSPSARWTIGQVLSAFLAHNMTN